MRRILRIWAGWKPALPVLIPMFIPLVGWLFRALTASLPPAREKALSLKRSHIFYMSVIDKSKDVTKTAE